MSQSNHLRMAVRVITFCLLWNLLLPLLPSLTRQSERSLNCTCCFRELCFYTLSCRKSETVHLQSLCLSKYHITQVRVVFFLTIFWFI